MSETSDISSMVHTKIPAMAQPDSPKKKVDLTRDVCAMEAVLLQRVDHVKDLIADDKSDADFSEMPRLRSKSMSTVTASADIAADAAAAASDETDRGGATLAVSAADLLKWKDMPKHLQFNRYIVEGYRPLTDVKGCLHSLFYFHNETINIITHGL